MQFGEVQLVARWVERHESVGSQHSVRGDDPSQSAIASGSLRPRQGGAPSGGSPHLLFQVEIHGGTRFGQELIHEMLVYRMLVHQWMGSSSAYTAAQTTSPPRGAEVGELDGKLRAVSFTRP